MTRDECLARAAEAEAMANIVSFAADKERLRKSAEDWRERAERATPSVRSRAPKPSR